MPDLLNAALRYAKDGWPVFPCEEAGKRPLTLHGLNDASTDPETIRAWWRKWPRANVAIPTGPATGVVVVDLDGEKGRDAFAGMVAQHGALPATLESKTGNGRHLLFRCPDPPIRNTQSKMGDGIDTRGEGGYIIVSPSVHPSGALYEWANHGVEPAELPNWLNPLNLKPATRPAPTPSMPLESDVVRRASLYLATMPGAVLGCGGHSALYAAATAMVHGFDLPVETAYQLLAAEFNPRCSPPWDLSSHKDERDFRRKLNQAKTQPHDRPLGYLLLDTVSDGDVEHGRRVANAILSSARRGEPEALPPASAPASFQSPVSLGDLIKSHPKLSDPVIDGLLRAGETANIIAASKVGKSWLMYSLLACIATGRRWLDTFSCEAGPVLLIDNELHPQTIANRLPKVTEAMGITTPDSIDILPLRGKGVTLDRLAMHIDRIEAGHYRAIVLDAWYRFIPKGLSENSNADIMGLFNLLDRYAEQTGAALIAVHHASKGSQGDKAVTDVGAGAGAQSRAADAHVVLRPHEDDGCVVMEAAVRSFKPIEPVGLRWDFPLWRRADSLDTRALQGRKTKQERRTAENDAEGITKIVEALRSGPLTTSKLRFNTGGMGKGRADRLLGRLHEAGKVSFENIKVRGQEAQEWSLVL